MGIRAGLKGIEGEREGEGAEGTISFTVLVVPQFIELASV